MEHDRSDNSPRDLLQSRIKFLVKLRSLNCEEKRYLVTLSATANVEPLMFAILRTYKETLCFIANDLH